MPRPGRRTLLVRQECQPTQRKGRAGDHAFFFSPSRIASGVIGICRTRTPTAL
jgi:hypothetical protein